MSGPVPGGFAVGGLDRLPPPASGGRLGEGGQRLVQRPGPAREPLVSYVTVVRNAVSTLPRTLASVRAQRGAAVEHLVIDACSTDGTRALIEAHAGQIDYWVSEPDGGLYDALNKAMSLVRGSLVCVLNADDWLTPDAAARALAALRRHEPRPLEPAPRLILSAAWLHNGPRRRLWLPGALDAGSWLRCPNLCHNGVYATPAALRAAGPYDTRLRIVADTRWLLAMVDAGVAIHRIGAPTVHYVTGGLSGDVTRHVQECARLLLDPEATPAHVDAFKAPRETRVAELIDVSSHPDLHVIRKERAEESSIKELRDRKQTNIPLDLLRELMIGGVVGDGKSFDSPVWRSAYLGHHKVFIIDEAELLDPYGQNALLKTLEEPPPGTYMFLVTTQEERLLPTIRSRCQRVAFRTLDAQSMQAWFERFAVPADQRAWLAEFSDGAPGTAELAHRHGLRAWSDELLPRFAAVEAGKFDAGLADRLAELVGEFAERVVKENPKASKEAANRLGTRCALLTLGSRSRVQIAEAARKGDAAVIAAA
ncbi:MAG: D-inositol 3-phosphate glycosyltransferase, partial [Pseudomonadota bacterium]